MARDSDTEQERKLVQIEKQDLLLNLFLLEQDVVEKWEVVTDTESLPQDPSPGSPLQPPPQTDMECLLTLLLDHLLSAYTVLPDTVTRDLLPAPVLLPLIGHPAPQVHTPAFRLLGEVFQCSPPSRAELGVGQDLGLVASIIRGHTVTQQGVEAALGLLHRHTVSLSITYVFPYLLPPTLEAMGRGEEREEQEHRERHATMARAL